MTAITRAQFLTLAGAACVAPAISARAAARDVLKRPIPKSGEMLPAMGLGTSQVFHEMGNAEEAQAKRDVVQALIDSGGTLIDTAPSYRDSENVCGQIISDLKARGQVFIATKVGIEGKEQGVAQLEASFKKLRTDKIDLIQVHNLRDTKTQLATLRELKAKGRVRYIGITHSQPSGQEALADFLASEDLDFVQLNYSVDVRDPEKRLLPLAKDRGVAVLVNLPLGRGRLLQKVKDKPMPGWATELGCKTYAQALLKFVLSHPAVTCPIPATSKAKHMVENMEAAEGALPDAKMRETIAAFWNEA